MKLPSGSASRPRNQATCFVRAPEAGIGLRLARGASAPMQEQALILATGEPPALAGGGATPASGSGVVFLPGLKSGARQIARPALTRRQLPAILPRRVVNNRRQVPAAQDPRHKTQDLFVRKEPKRRVDSSAGVLQDGWPGSYPCGWSSVEVQNRCGGSTACQNCCALAVERQAAPVCTACSSVRIPQASSSNVAGLHRR